MDQLYLRWPWAVLLALLSAAALLAGCRPAPELAAVRSPAQMATTPTATASSPSKPSATPTELPTETPEPTVTPSATASPSATATPSPTATSIPTSTPTPTPQPTPDGVQRQVRLPILMYHYLSEPPPGADRYRRDLSVAPDLFEEHLAYLQAEGYQSIDLYGLLYHLTLGWPLPDKPVIITFDDGYVDNYQNAFPLLQEYGFSATFFVITEVTDLASAEAIAANGFEYAKVYMTWEQLQEMAEAGMDIECHARVHENLTESEDDRLVWQVLSCREMIESHIGKRPRFVAYPGGAFDPRVQGLFASDHYWGGVTTHQGDLHTTVAPFEINRLRVRGTTGVDELALLLAGVLE